MDLDAPAGPPAKRMPKPLETQMLKVAWIALALLSGAATVSQAQGLPAAATAVPSEKTSVPPVAPASDGAHRKAIEAKPASTSSGNKSFFESRSNTAITDAPAVETPEQAAARKGKGTLAGQAGIARPVGTAKSAQAGSSQGSAAATIQPVSPATSSAPRSALKD
jgi:hypothetical protein